MSLVSQLDAATIAYYLPLVNNIWKDSPVLNKLMSKTRKVSGGSSIKVPVVNSNTCSGGPYDKNDTLTITPTPFLTENTYTWTHYWKGNALNKIDVMENQGDKTQIVNLLTNTMQIIKDSMQDTLETDICSGSAVSSLNMLSIHQYLDYVNHPTVGVIDRSTSEGTFFRSNLTSSVGLLTYEVLTTKMNDCKKHGKKYPDLIVTTQAIWEKLYSMNFAKIGFMNTQQPISDGMPKFWGTDIIWADNVPTGEIWFINTDHMYLVVHPKDNLQWSGWVDKEPINRTKIIEGSVGITTQLICYFPMSCGILQGVTTSA
jgi:hypothetical protein